MIRIVDVDPEYVAIKTFSLKAGGQSGLRSTTGRCMHDQFRPESVPCALLNDFCCATRVAECADCVRSTGGDDITTLALRCQVVDKGTSHRVSVGRVTKSEPF